MAVTTSFLPQQRMLRDPWRNIIYRSSFIFAPSSLTSPLVGKLGIFVQDIAYAVFDLKLEATSHRGLLSLANYQFTRGTVEFDTNVLKTDPNAQDRQRRSAASLRLAHPLLPALRLAFGLQSPTILLDLTACRSRRYMACRMATSIPPAATPFPRHYSAAFGGNYSRRLQAPLPPIPALPPLPAAPHLGHSNATYPALPAAPGCAAAASQLSRLAPSAFCSLLAPSAPTAAPTAVVDSLLTSDSNR
ncbi:hypothetical protein B0H19DRAFT_1386746 [Mycena capillaripes]|nr:hypothetical protein B0H19DRAFT_1386746 [Mycena capillaripes]